MDPTALSLLKAYLGTLAALMGAGVVILLAGIPWALRIERRLGHIESWLRPDEQPPDQPGERGP